MRFYCGETYEQKMARKRKEDQRRIEAECEWHRKFAWFPVRFTEDKVNTCAWLEWVLRRRKTLRSHAIAGITITDAWEYAPMSNNTYV